MIIEDILCSRCWAEYYKLSTLFIHPIYQVCVLLLSSIHWAFTGCWAGKQVSIYWATIVCWWLQFILSRICSYIPRSQGSWLRVEIPQDLLWVSWPPSEGLTHIAVTHSFLQYCSGNSIIVIAASVVIVLKTIPEQQEWQLHILFIPGAVTICSYDDPWHVLTV